MGMKDMNNPYNEDTTLLWVRVAMWLEGRGKVNVPDYLYLDSRGILCVDRKKVPLEDKLAVTFAAFDRFLEIRDAIGEAYVDTFNKLVATGAFYKYWDAKSYYNDKDEFVQLGYYRLPNADYDPLQDNWNDEGLEWIVFENVYTPHVVFTWGAGIP